MGESYHIIDVDPLATKVRCPSCHRHYSVLTRFVSSAHARLDRHGRRHYDFITREPGGRDRPRSIRVSQGVQIRPNTWITLVWRGDNLVGVADQTANEGEGAWLEIRLPPTRDPFDRIWQWALYACLVVTAMQALRLCGATASLVSSQAPAVLFLILFALAFFVPVIHWMITVATTEEDEPIEDPFA